MKYLCKSALVCSLVILCLICCNPAPKLIFFSENYWWEFINKDDNAIERLSSISREYGFDPEYILLKDDDNQELLISTIKEKDPVLVVVGAFMWLDIKNIAALETDKLFIVMGVSPSIRRTTANILYVTTDRSEIFSKAGKTSAHILNGQYPDVPEELIGKKLGILYSSTTEQAREDVKSFESGFLSVSEPGLIISEQIKRNNDTVEATRLINDLWAKDVRLFLLKTYTLNFHCLENIGKKGGYVILEDWPYNGQYNENIIFSIEEDVAASFQVALKQIKIRKGIYYFEKNIVNTHSKLGQTGIINLADDRR